MSHLRLMFYSFEFSLLDIAFVVSFVATFASPPLMTIELILNEFLKVFWLISIGSLLLLVECWTFLMYHSLFSAIYSLSQAVLYFNPQLMLGYSNLTWSINWKQSLSSIRIHVSHALQYWWLSCLAFSNRNEVLISFYYWICFGWNFIGSAARGGHPGVGQIVYL